MNRFSRLLGLAALLGAFSAPASAFIIIEDFIMGRGETTAEAPKVSQAVADYRASELYQRLGGLRSISISPAALKQWQAAGISLDIIIEDFVGARNRMPVESGFIIIEDIVNLREGTAANDFVIIEDFVGFREPPAIQNFIIIEDIVNLRESVTSNDFVIIEDFVGFLEAPPKTGFIIIEDFVSGREKAAASDLTIVEDQIIARAAEFIIIDDFIMGRVAESLNAGSAAGQDVVISLAGERFEAPALRLYPGVTADRTGQLRLQWFGVK